MDDKDASRFPQLTPTEQRIIDRFRYVQTTSRGRSFTLIVTHGGGAAPVVFYEAKPIGRGPVGDKDVS